MINIRELKEKDFNNLSFDLPEGQKKAIQKAQDKFSIIRAGKVIAIIGLYDDIVWMVNGDLSNYSLLKAMKNLSDLGDGFQTNCPDTPRHRRFLEFLGFNFVRNIIAKGEKYCIYRR